MTARHTHHAHIVGAFVKFPQPLEPGQVHCNGCGAAVTLTKNGKTRAHLTPAGEPCAYRAFYGQAHLEETPPVVIPPPRGGNLRTVARSRPPSAQPSAEAIANDARLAPRNGECIECGRWLPGERTLCGACAVARRRR